MSKDLATVGRINSLLATFKFQASYSTRPNSSLAGYTPTLSSPMLSALKLILRLPHVKLTQEIEIDRHGNMTG